MGLLTPNENRNLKDARGLVRKQRIIGMAISANLSIVAAASLDIFFPGLKVDPLTFAVLCLALCVLVSLIATLVSLRLVK